MKIELYSMLALRQRLRASPQGVTIITAFAGTLELQQDRLRDAGAEVFHADA